MSISILLSAFALGLALAGSPGPVQAVLLAESTRGGRRRGFAAMLGASLMFALLLVGLAAGLAVGVPSGTPARPIRLAGGLFLIVLAVDTGLSARRPPAGEVRARGLRPTPRGVLAVVLNPGAWVFVGTTAAALIAEATHRGGRPFAFVTAAAMLAGVMLIDGTLVLLASQGRVRLGSRGTARLAMVLAAGLGVFGLVFVVSALA